MGAFTLLVVGIATRQLRGEALSALLREVMATAGALFALLIGATTLTLVLRIYGTDALVADWITGIPGGERTAVAAVLGAIGLCAFVLDAFEIIFVIVPIVIPPLLVRAPDAIWVAVLVLLSLQASFLLPPFGYALMMARSAMKEAVPLGAVLRSLAYALLDRGGDFLRLAVAEADVARTVAHDDERGEREAATALHDLGDSVDGDDAFVELTFGHKRPLRAPNRRRVRRRRRPQRGRGT